MRSASAAERSRAKLDPMTKAEYAYAELRRQIIDGEVAAGTRLRLRQLAGELRLSEMPIREALRLLQRDGLVSFQSHRGATVTAVSLEQVMERISMRTWLEVLATEDAVRRHTSRSLAAAETALERAGAAAREGDPLQFSAANRSFHERVHAPAGPLLRDAIATEWDRVWQARRGSSLFALCPARMAEAQEEHRRLFEALRRRSTADAVMAMTEHRRRTLDSWRKAFL
jgi:DNA-binding GntR family transcriptional regulator